MPGPYGPGMPGPCGPGVPGPYGSSGNQGQSPCGILMLTSKEKSETKRLPMMPIRDVVIFPYK